MELFKHFVELLQQVLSYHPQPDYSMVAQMFGIQPELV